MSISMNTPGAFKDESISTSTSPVGTSKVAAKAAGASQSAIRADNLQSLLGKKEPKGKLHGSTLLSGYKPTGQKVSYSDNKIGVLADIERVISEIADVAGVDTSDEDEFNAFLEALVTDVYVNAYSDKSTFEGSIRVGTFSLDREKIRDVIQSHVGTAYRRYARAMAPIVVKVMSSNSAFRDLLDKRAVEVGVTREEALYRFDGADSLPNVNRDVYAGQAESKALALRTRNDVGVYDLKVGAGSADARVGGVDSNRSSVSRGSA